MDNCPDVQIYFGKSYKYYCNMDANEMQSLSTRLKNELKKRKVSVPVFQEQTGIPKDRVYKWLKRSTAKIGHEDADTVNKWLNGQLEIVPHETATGESETDQDLRVAIRELSESTNRHSITDERNSRNIERLLNILDRFSSGHTQTTDPEHPKKDTSKEIQAKKGDLALRNKYTGKKIVKGN
jgi:hypothetical protein